MKPSHVAIFICGVEYTVSSFPIDNVFRGRVAIFLSPLGLDQGVAVASCWTDMRSAYSFNPQNLAIRQSRSYGQRSPAQDHLYCATASKYEVLNLHRFFPVFLSNIST